MARVPVTTEFARPTTALGNERLRYVGARDFVGPAVEQLGRAGQDAADAFDKIEAAYDDSDVLEADNTIAAEHSAELSAFKQLRGNVPAAEIEARLKKLEQGGERLVSGRRSERAKSIARRTFAQRLTLTGNAMREHADKEMFEYRDAALVTGAAQAARDAIDAFGTADFDVHLDVAMLRLEERGRHRGWSEQELAEQRAAVGAEIWGNVILTQEAEGNPAAALATLDQVKDRIPPALEIKLRGMLTPRVDAREARDAFPSVLEQYLAENGPAVPAPQAGAPAAAPPPGGAVSFERLAAITVQSESGGNPNAVSPVGARGLMQVMPGTGRDPGFGIRPSNGSQADDVRVGREYLAKMQERYGGDLSKMWAAYNAGPGRVDELIRKHGNGWLNFAPRETRDYVAKNLKAVRGVQGQDGGSVVPAPVDPRLDPRIADAAARWWAEKNGLSEDKAEAYIAASQDFVARERGRIDQAEQDSDRRLLDWINNNKPGADDLSSLSDIPAAILDGISPGMQSRLQDRIDATQNRALARQQARAAAGAEAAKDRAILDLYRLSDDDLARTDLRQFEGIVPASTLGPWYAKQRKAAGGGKGLSSDRLASLLDTIGKDFGASRGVDASEDERKLWVDTASYVEQRLSGLADGEITREDLRAHIINGLQETQIAGSGWFGSNVGNSTVRRAQLPDGADIDLDDIPASEVAKIREGLRSRGVPDTPRNIFDAYQRARARGLVP